MMFKSQVTVTALAILLFAWGARADLKQWTVLAPEYATAVTQQCSRNSPDDFEATWMPTEEDIAELEERLQTVETTQSTACCLPGRSVVGVENYYRQYIGIVVESRKLIYINAFRRGTETENWDSEPVVYCDGGDLFWGVFYDPETKEFFDLAFNGEG